MKNSPASFLINIHHSYVQTKAFSQPESSFNRVPSPYKPRSNTILSHLFDRPTVSTKVQTQSNRDRVEEKVGANWIVVVSIPFGAYWRLFCGGGRFVWVTGREMSRAEIVLTK